MNLYFMSDMILEIITHPQNRQLKFGSDVTLICTSSLSSNVTFLWIHNGKTVWNYLSVNDATSRLTLSNVGYSDGGRYVCIVRSGSLSVTSNTATITINGKLNCTLYFINCYLIIVTLF